MTPMFALAALLSIPFTPQSVPAPQTRVVTTGACERLGWEWRHVEKRMAFDFAIESLRYNAPPMIELHLAEANDLARASLILQLLKDNACPIPTSVPNAGTYSDATFACIKARQAKATDAPVLCDEERWLPNR